MCHVVVDGTIVGMTLTEVDDRDVTEALSSSTSRSALWSFATAIDSAVLMEYTVYRLVYPYRLQMESTSDFFR